MTVSDDPPALTLDPDRLFPCEPLQRAVARDLYAAVRDLPLVSPHGHVDARLLADNSPFPDPARLLVTPDHYVTRMLYSQGIPLESLGVARRDGSAVESDGRSIWRVLCSNWHLYRGTPSRLWLEHELHELFGIRLRPSSATADVIYDAISSRLREPEFRPRELYRRFRLEVLATTDSPLDSLEHHQRLRDDSSWDGRVLPTFRPDALVDITGSQWPSLVRRLSEVSGVDASTYGGFISALEERRSFFRSLGCTATDHGHDSAETAPMETPDAERVFDRALRGDVDAGDGAAFRAHMLSEFARMSCDDGLVMQLHPGVRRNYDSELFHAFGADVGADIPLATEYTRALRPLLDRYGAHPNFTIVLFTVDETSFSREIAPLAGVYPSVRIGAPWWFLDAPNAAKRFREAAVETAGFYNTAGFVDDTRAFCSIPARHDMARRTDCRYLSGLVVEGLLGLDEAIETAIDLAYTIPKSVFKV